MRPETNNRRDAWTEEHDSLLASTVVSNARKGITKQESFHRVAVQIGRTSGACAFRWNKVLSQFEGKSYEDARMEYSKSQDYRRAKAYSKPSLDYVNDVVIRSEKGVWLRCDTRTNTVTILQGTPTEVDTELIHHVFVERNTQLSIFPTYKPGIEN